MNLNCQILIIFEFVFSRQSLNACLTKPCHKVWSFIGLRNKENSKTTDRLFINFCRPFHFSRMHFLSILNISSCHSNSNTNLTSNQLLNWKQENSFILVNVLDNPKHLMINMWGWRIQYVEQWLFEYCWNL